MPGRDERSLRQRPVEASNEALDNRVGVVDEFGVGRLRPGLVLLALERRGAGVEGRASRASDLRQGHPEPPVTDEAGLLGDGPRSIGDAPHEAKDERVDDDESAVAPEDVGRLRREQSEPAILVDGNVRPPTHRRCDVGLRSI